MRSLLLPLVALSFLVACAGSDEDEGVGGEGGGTTVTNGSTTATTTTTGTPTTTSGMMTTSSSTSSSTASSGGGGMGEGGMNEGGGPPEGYILETEPNDTFGQANDLPDGEVGFAGELPDGDIDVFAVEAPLGATMSVVVSDGIGGCPADANMMVQIYDPSDLVIAQASSLCPTLNGNNDPDLNSLVQAGTYFIYVTAPAEVAQYAIDITVNPPVCGDTFVQLGEECDDGNTVPADGCENDCTVTPVCGDSSLQTGEECDDGNTNNGDGCDSACQYEGSLCPETEVNNTIAQANAGPGCTDWMGQISVVGDIDYFAVEVTVAGSSLTAEVVDVNGTGCPSGFDSTLRLHNAAMSELVYDDDGAAAGLCSLISPSLYTAASNLPVGTYYLAVRELGDNATSPPYRLHVNVAAPGCGDGTIQAPEECDDGNVAAGDGCSPTCTYEGGMCNETEPNNAQATANVLSNCAHLFTEVTTVGDVDWFQINVPVAGTDLKIEVFDGGSSQCMATGDPHIYLHNSVGTELGGDDDSGPGLCSLIDPAVSSFAQNLAAGTYYLRYEEHGNDSTVPLARVKFTFLP